MSSDTKEEYFLFNVLTLQLQLTYANNRNRSEIEMHIKDNVK